MPNMFGQFADRPFVAAWRSICGVAAAIFGRGDAGLEQEMMHHLCIEGVATLGRSPTFAIEDLGDARA